MSEAQKRVRDRAGIGDLVQVASLRREADWVLPMGERLARLHSLCKQMTAIQGAAHPR